MQPIARCLSVLAAALLLGQCGASLQEKTVWEHELGKAGSEITLPVGIDLPQDVGIAFITSGGFDSWNEVLERNSNLMVTLEFVEDGKVTGSYQLSVDTPQNCRLMKPLRSDGKSDLGWRLVNKAQRLQSITLKTSKGQFPDEPVRIRLLKLP